MGKFEAVSEGSAGSENRIPQAHRANLYAEINGASGTHFAQKDTTKLERDFQFFLESEVEFADCTPRHLECAMKVASFEWFLILVLLPSVAAGRQANTSGGDLRAEIQTV
jgi:hypothetical protein